MSTVKNNNIFEKTSFLGGNSSEFIKSYILNMFKTPKVSQASGKNFSMASKTKKRKLLTRQKDPVGQEKRLEKTYIKTEKN